MHNHDYYLLSPSSHKYFTKSPNPLLPNTLATHYSPRKKQVAVKPSSRSQKKGSLPKLQYLRHLTPSKHQPQPSSTSKTVYLADKPLSEVTFSAQSTELETSIKDSITSNVFTDYGLNSPSPHQHSKHTPSWQRPRLERQLKEKEHQYRKCIRVVSREKDRGDIKFRMKGLLDQIYAIRRQLG